jgi:hypothetical protein
MISNTDLLEEEKEHSLPSVNTAVKNLISRHSQEIREVVDIIVPRIGPSAKKLFREFYMKEATNIFNFLDNPISENQTISQAYQIIKRFGKGEYIGNKNKLRDLVLDISCNETISLIEESIGSFSDWIIKTRNILDLWKQVTTDFSIAENRLKSRIVIFDDLAKKVQTLLQLPNIEGYEEMLNSSETYIRNIFEEHQIENEYNEFIKVLKKIVILTDAIYSIRQMVNASTDPVCSVCFHDPVNIVSIPCGHTFCTQCGGKQLTNCYICRMPVRDRIKIYFS